MIDESKIKDFIENAYLQQKQMVETNALIMENYIRTIGNNDLTKNIENAKSYYLNLTDQSKKRMLDTLDQIRNDFLSNANKIKNDYENGTNIFKSGDRFKADSNITKSA